MKLLLSNDDGIDAPGLQALREAASEFGQYRVYAPIAAYSGCSHRLTTDKPIRIDRRGDREIAVDGTPGDCVRLALHQSPDEFDWVLAGVNDGGNLGVDVFYSGTVAAVREAAIHGASAIAFSHYARKGVARNWRRAARWTAQVFARLIEMPRLAGSFWSVNLPHLDDNDPEPEIIFCPLDTNPLPLVYDERDDGFHDAGEYAKRPRTQGSDVEVCFGGRIAVTRLSTCHGCQI